MTRATYDRHLIVPIPVESGLYRRYIRMEYDFVGGEVTRCMISFEIEVDEEVYQVVRFDTDDGCFHRHHPDFPEPSPERTWLPHVAPNDRLAYARDEILRNYREWETVVLGRLVLRIEGTEE